MQPLCHLFEFSWLHLWHVKFFVVQGDDLNTRKEHPRNKTSHHCSHHFFCQLYMVEDDDERVIYIYIYIYRHAYAYMYPFSICTYERNTV